MGRSSLRQVVLTTILWSIFIVVGRGIDLPVPWRPHPLVVLPQIRLTPIYLLRGDERQRHPRFQCRDDQMQHEVDKKLETA